jgi:hypothetical protein
MKTNITDQQAPVRFHPETRFSLEPKFAPANHEGVQTVFEDLKTRLLKPVLGETLDPDLRRQLRLAANEAAAMAWMTPFPLLFLPALLDEKAAEAHHHALRQQEVQEATQALADASP